VTSVLDRPTTSTPAVPPPAREHLLSELPPPLWINGLVDRSHGHIAVTHDGQPHVVWDRGADVILRAECGVQGVAPASANHVPQQATGIVHHCGDCKFVHNRLRADLGLPPLDLERRPTSLPAVCNPGGSELAPAHSMVLAAALAASRISTLGMSTLRDHRDVDSITRMARAQLHPWDIVSLWRERVDLSDVRPRWEAAVGAVARLYPELVEADREGPLPDLDTATNLDFFLPPARRAAAG
jgi:hypothetical protein